MNIAITLLMAAMTLLTSVSGNPNIDPALKNQAIDVANQAVTLANIVINSSTTDTDTSIQSQNPAPVFGSVSITPVPVAILVNGQDTDTFSLVGGNCGKFSANLSVKNSDGSITNSNSYSFRTPMTTGTTTDVVTASNLSKTINYNVINPNTLSNHPISDGVSNDYPVGTSVLIVSDNGGASHNMPYSVSANKCY